MDYPKIYRIPIPNFPMRGTKHYLTEKEVNELLDGRVVIEEKIDGKLGGVDINEHIVYFEYMKYKHNIYYTTLPSVNIAFDVWNGKIFLDYNEKMRFLRENDFPNVRLLYMGKTNYEELLKYLPKLMGSKSFYADEIVEGIIIKNYKKQLFGKVVNPKFEEDIDNTGHWLKQPKVLNRIVGC